jgi:hypothetical protein
MKPSAFSALTTAAVFACAVPLVAQSSATTTAQRSDRFDTGKEITLTGCVEKNKSGGHFLTHAMMAPGAPGAAASTTTASGSTATTGTTGTTASTTTTTPASASTWNLENGHDLDRYINQKVQVVGHPEKSTSGDEVKGTTGPETKARDFDVKSVRAISGSCSEK